MNELNRIEEIIGEHLSKQPTFKIGAHISMSDLVQAVEAAHNIGANILMVYTGSPKNVSRKPIEVFKVSEGQDLMSKFGITDVVVHAPYIINLASSDRKKYELAVNVLSEEIVRAAKLGAGNLVVHTGYYTGSTFERGWQNIYNAMTQGKLHDTIIEHDVTVCLETLCGKGTEMGVYFEEFGWFLSALAPDIARKVGVCLDTCHVWDAGYDISYPDVVLNHFDRTVGLEKLKVVHVNGSLSPLGGKKDRHANLGADESNPVGRDCIGAETIRKFVRRPELKDKLFILETPMNDDIRTYAEEIKYLKSEAGS